MTLTIGACVTKSAKWAMYGAASSNAQTNGIFDPAYVVSINSIPTIQVNDRVVTTGPGLFQNTSLLNTGSPDAPIVGFPLECGSVERISMANSGTSSYTNPTATWDGFSGGGSSLTLGTPFMVSGILTCAVGNGGNGYTDGTFQYVVAGGSFTNAATLLVTCVGGVVVSAVPVAGGVLGCGSGYAGTFTSNSIGTSGSKIGGGFGATVTCTVGNCVINVPVISSSSDFTGMPQITLHDTGGGSGAVAAPVMSGPLSTDSITYSAPANWLTTALSFLSLKGVVTSGSPTITGMTTSTLTVGDTATCSGFIPLGATIATINSGSSITLTVNATASGSPTIYFGVPVTANGATNAPVTNSVGVLEGPLGNLSGFNATPTMLLGANSPSQQSGDPSVFMAKNRMLCAHAWAMGSRTTSLTYDSLWNPATWTPGGTITSFVYGSGGPFPYFMGVYTFQYDDAFYAVPSGAPSPTIVNIVPFQAGTVTITPGTQTVSGTTVTNTYNVQYITLPETTSYSPNLVVELTSTDGVYHLSDPWLFAPGNTIDRSNRYALDDNVVAFLKGPTGRGPAVLRFMDSINGFGGLSNWIDPPDVENPNNFSFYTQYPTAQSFPTPWTPIGSNNNKGGTAIASGVRCLNTNTAATQFPGVSTKLYSSQPWAVSGTDSFGSYLLMTNGPLGANDNGTLMYPNFGHLSQVVCMELVFPTTHGIKTGQLVSLVNPIFNCTYTLNSSNVTITGPNANTSGANMSNVLAGMPISGNGIASAVTLTGTVTVGSPTVTGLTGSGGLTTSAFLAGAMATASGSIPGGTAPTYVQSINSSSSITLSANATANGTVSIVFTAAPTTIATVNSPTSITMSAPSTFAGSGTVTINSIVPTTSSGNINIMFSSMAFVTGPNTIVVYVPESNFGNQVKQGVTSIAFGGPATAQIPIYLAVQLTQPPGEGFIPAEFAASIVSYFPNCELWFNLSYLSSDALVQLMAQKIAPYLGPTNTVRVEFGNEHWDSGSAFTQWLVEQVMARIPAYLPAGTPLWNFENTSNVLTGYTVPSPPAALANADYAYALRTAHAFYVFKQAGIAAGIPASRIKCSFGSWWAGSSVTANLAAMFDEYAMPAASVHVAPYSPGASGPPAFSAACSPAGATVTNAGVPITAGNLPVDAINDYYRYAHFYSLSYWTTYASHQTILGPRGIPLVAYETALQNTASSGAIDYQALSTDCAGHTSYDDAQWCFYLSLQQGNPTNQYGGLTLSNYFTYCSSFSAYLWASGGNNMWKLADGVSQAPGDGSTNLFLTPQGGAPGTRFGLGYSQVNTSVALQTMIKWNNVTTPAPPSPVVATTATLDGPTMGSVGIPLTYSVVFDGTFSGTLTPSDGHGGTFNPSSLSGNGTFTYTPTAAGTISLSITSSPALLYAGSPLTLIATSTFSPTDVVLMPPSSAFGVAIGTSIAIQLNEPLLGSSVNSSTLTLMQGSLPVPGTVAYSTVTWLATFTPTRPLMALTTYTAEATTGIENAAGASLAATIVWQFTTARIVAASDLGRTDPNAATWIKTILPGPD